jgi:hypothetical protein
LQPGDPNLIGAEAKEEKKGIKGRVKGLFHRHGKKKDAQHSSGVTGKLKAKMDKKVGHGEVDEEGNPKQGVARLLSMSSSTSSMSSSDEEDIGTVGFAMDPTQPAVAGLHLGRKDFTSAPTGPGADLSKINLLKSDANATTEEHAKRATEYAELSDPIKHPDSFNQVPDSHGGVEGSPNYGGVEGNSNYGGVDRSHGGNSSLNSNDGDSYGAPGHSHPTDFEDSKWKHGEGAGHVEPHTSRIASDDGEPRPTNPTGMTNSEGGAVLDNHQGPRDDGVKQEGFMSKIMDTFRGTKGEPAATSKD